MEKAIEVVEKQVQDPTGNYIHKEEMKIYLLLNSYTQTTPTPIFKTGITLSFFNGGYLVACSVNFVKTSLERSTKPFIPSASNPF